MLFPYGTGRPPLRALAAITLSAVSAFAVSAQSAAPGLSPWTIAVSPSVAIPLVSGDFAAAPAFGSAWGGKLAAEYGFGTAFPLALRLGAGYAIGALADYDGVSLSGSLGEALFTAGAGTGAALTERLAWHAFIDGGVAFGSLSTGTTAAYGAAEAGLGLSFAFTRNFTARLDAAGLYKAGLYGGVGATLGISYRPAERPKANQSPNLRLLEFSSIDMQGVFPVLRSYYDQNPVGSLRITNTGKATAENLRVHFIVRQYMDAPKDCGSVDRLEPGASVDLPIYALFNDRILNVTEPTKVSGEFVVDYGDAQSQSRSVTVLVYDRNALTWSDDRRAAAFVSSRDPWVLDLTGQVIAAVKSLRNSELPKAMQTVMAIHEGLRLYGIGYMIGTIRPFDHKQGEAEIVDTLKFPRQTLAFRAGDCADLSVLYASCLEAAGVETAFITVPGHILLAFDLGITESAAVARSMDKRDYIVRDGSVWLPIETTMRDSDFPAIWKKGAAQWREATEAKTAAFYPIHDAWKIYAPMGLPADGSTVATPPSDKIGSAFSAVLGKAVGAELAARVSSLKAQPGLDPSSPAFLNKRGVLYGKYGWLKEAQTDFQAASKAGSVSALVNLGNIAMLRGDPAQAYDFYSAAKKKMPPNASLYLNLAMAASAIGKQDAATAAVAEARVLDPSAADSYEQNVQTGSQGTRAAESGEDGPAWF